MKTNPGIEYIISLKTFVAFARMAHLNNLYHNSTFPYEKIMKIDHHRGPVVCVAISSTSEVLVSGSTDNTICLWSLDTYELLNQLQFNSPVLKFCLSPDSVGETALMSLLLKSFIFSLTKIFLLAHCEDNGLYLRTLATGTELHQLKGHKSKVTFKNFIQKFQPLQISKTAYEQNDAEHSSNLPPTEIDSPRASPAG